MIEKKILFVCTGNICRSAMAEHYMQKRLKEEKLEEKIIVNSCGINAFTGDISTKNAKESMKEYEVSLESHRATNIADIDIENYDIILVMTNNLKIEILRLFKNLKDKTYTLKEYTKIHNDNIDILDPWGLNIDSYKNCAREIVQAIDTIINNIKKE